ncbi:MAG: tannase/feruloyl esterase family alpha/beta hydrolase [Acidobacteria bacterium]|nr:tannase/feruloyl esterase family alpha/beta hydrolase [Acidobacteriota bacterium]
MKRVIAATVGVGIAVVGIVLTHGDSQELVAAQAAQAAACERVMALSLPNTTITGAELVAAGGFTPPGGGRPPSAAQMRVYADLPAFCRVSATLTPSDDSDIKVEVWLPAEGWNGKYQAVGNGAFTGSIRHGNMAAAVALGYASSSTDTGHVGNTASFGLGHPEKVIDFGYRSIHEMTVVSKAAGAALLLLERLLGRRPAGDEGGAALPGGLRWHHRRRPGPGLDRPRGRLAARGEAPGGRRVDAAPGRRPATGARRGARRL